MAFAQRLPWLLLSLISGALVDRLDRRLLMAAVDGSHTVLLLGLGGMSIGALIGGVLARGFGLTAPFGFASASVAALILFVWRIISNRTVAEAQAPSS